jgi:hypothetical protein
VIISTDAEKALDKNSTFLHEKSLMKLVIEGIYLNIIKARHGQVPVIMPVILDTQEAEIRRIAV